MSQLDYKIHNINILSNDESIEPIERAIIAVNKFSKLSDSEYITSTVVCERILNLIDDLEFNKIINKGGTFIDIASKMAEFSIAIYKRSTNDLNYDYEKIKDNIYAIPTSPIAYEFTRKIYEILKLNLENIATKFNSYDIVNIRKLDGNGNLTNDLDIDRIVKLLSQNKEFSEIELEDDLFTKEGDEEVKFDVVVGNPPYQVSDGGALASAKPIYHYFVQLSERISSRFTSLIIPTRWFAGGKGLDEFRSEMLNDTHIRELHDCLTPEDIFPNTNIRGGVCYFLRDGEYDNSNDFVKVVTYENDSIVYEVDRPMKISNHEVFIRDGRAKTIIDKILSVDNFESIAPFVSSRKPFGLDGNFGRSENFKKDKSGISSPVICYSKGKTVGYIKKADVVNNLEWVDKWKVFIPRANNIGTELNDDNMNSFIGKPKTTCTESYLAAGAALDLDENSAKNLEKYFKTKFLRYLHSLFKSSQDATSKTFELIPLQDFTVKSDIDWSKSINDIDQQLYEKYNFSADEIEYINSKIKDM